MKPRAVLGGVILGFAILCGLGFWLLGQPDEEPPTPPLGATVTPALPPLPPPEAVPPKPPVRATAAVSPPRPKPARVPTFPLPPPPTARAALAPMVNVCFAENADLALGPPRAVLRFTPTADGHLSHGQVVSVSARRPWVRACLEEVMEDARFAPGGSPPGKPTEVRFRYTTDGGTSAVLR